MEKPSRVRVVFDNKVLNKYQVSEGFECCWVSLKPDIKKISDLQLHVQRSFSLDKKCPNGVVLYVNDFILPPFESTRMLNESDIISVRKKKNANTDSDKVCNQPLPITEAGENSNSKKRNMDNAIGINMHKENGIDIDTHLSSRKKMKKSYEIPRPKKKDKAKVAMENEIAPPVPSGSWQWQTQKEQVTNSWSRPANQKTQNYGHANKWNQSNAPNNNWNDHRNNSNQNHAINTWSKWISINDHNGQTSNWNNKNDKELCNETTNGSSDLTNNSDQNNDANNWNKLVNATDHNGQTSNLSNKKDKELCKGTTSGWNDGINSKKQCNGHTSQGADGCIDNEQSNEKENAPSSEKKESSPIDFESLFPLTRVPRTGDLIAYRLIEMTPQWCPFVTSFRIGEVTSYNYLNLNVVLIPVPEYPIFTDDKDQQKSSQYKEDGTLEIHYPSLIDVRLFKPFDLSETSSDAFGSPERRKSSPKGKAAAMDKCEEALANEDGNANGKENTDTEGIQEQAFTIEHNNAREKERTDALNTLEQTLATEDSTAKEIAATTLENENAMEQFLLVCTFIFILIFKLVMSIQD